MSLILRVDVDKPYGKHTLFRKVLSKLKEDYLPGLSFTSGYLSHLKEFIHFCNDNVIQGHFYHRICTAPDKEVMNLYAIGKHKIGHHLENSRCYQSFIEEYSYLKKIVGDASLASFSKHGSGKYKLGKYHYPPYEPEKYRIWAENFGISYHFGNGISMKASDLESKSGFFENVFWIEPQYRSESFDQITDLIATAENNDVAILIHPCNFVADKETRNEFNLLVALAKEFEIKWRVLD